MTVREYLNTHGTPHRVETPPEGAWLLGEAREGGHRVAFWAKEENGTLTQVVFSSSKRCKKLLALADRVCTLLAGQPASGFRLDPEDVLAFFQEERDREKLRMRLDLILRALYGEEKPTGGKG